MRLSIRIIVPVLIIFFAIFLRLYMLPEFAMFLGDQGRDAIIVKRIATLEHFPAIGAPSSLGQIFLGPFFYYLTAPFLLLFNFNPVGPVYGVALISILGIVASYLIVKKEINWLTAVFFLTFSTFSIVMIEYSRFSWNPNLVSLFAFLTLYFYYKFLTTRNYRYAVLCGGFWSLAVQLHHLTLFLIGPIVVFFILETIKRKKLLSYFVGSFIAFAAFFIVSIPLFIFDLRHDFLNSKNFVTLFTTTNLVDDSSLQSRLLDTNRAFYEYALHLPIDSRLAFLITLLFMVYFLRKFNDRKHLFLQINFVSVILYLFAFSFLNSVRLSHYYNTIYISFYLMLSYVLAQLVNKNKVLSILSVAVLASFVIINMKNVYFFNQTPENQIKKAERIADSILQRHPSPPFQMVALPNVETDGHIRYFLEIKGKRPLPADTLEEPQELYVLCFEECQVLGNAQWQIAAFKQAKIDTMWTSDGVAIYKLVHETAHN